MAKAVITAAPQETVTAVVRRITGAGVGGAPIVEGDRVVGLVTLEDLVGQPPYRPIHEVMTRDVVTAPPSARITDVYALMTQHHVSRMPIVEGGVLVGIVTRGDLLQELGRLTDPLTDLPWSGTLRQQAADLLKEGREISVVFMDLDDFGLANKLYGHVVGDRVIQAVGALLRDKTSSDTDVISRYAGDEFAIVTTRSVEESLALAHDLRTAVLALDVAGAPPGSINASFGVAGGKRATERHDIHYDATVDDLLTMASRASTLAKRTTARVLHSSQVKTVTPPGPADEDRRIVIRRIDLGVEDGRGEAIVELEYDGRRVTGRAEGSVLGSGGLRLLVDATVTAVRPWLPPQWQVVVEEIARTPLDRGEAVHILFVTGSPHTEERLVVGSALYTADPHEAVVKATMKAMNRVLAHGPQASA
jgi:diguanylate cyclase (GGDEF)-like protein